MRNSTVTRIDASSKGFDDIDAIKIAEWNEYVVIAKGNHLEHFINGKKTIDVTDQDSRGAKEGVLAFQMHAGPPMVVEFKDIVLKAAK